MANVKKAILNAMVNDVLTKLMVETQADQVLLNDTETVASKIAEIVAALNGKVTAAEVQEAITAALPTKVSDLDNDAKYQTDTDVAAAVAAADHLKRKKVESVSAIDVSAADADQYIYMVPIAGAKSENKYDEYMVIDGAIEKVGDWAIDLSDYAKTTDVDDALDDKVDKVTGKGLSTNDYTDADKSKLDGIAAGADVNVLEGVKVNGTVLTIGADKTVNVAVPTGALANKDAVAETDLDAELKAKVNAAADGNHSHANKEVLDGITAAKVSEWDGKSRFLVSATQPSDLKAGDLWVQVIQ